MHDHQPLTTLAEAEAHVADLLDADGGPACPSTWPQPTAAELTNQICIQPFANGAAQESVRLADWVDDTRTALSLLAENNRHTQHDDPANRRQHALLRRLSFRVIDALEQLEAVAMRLEQSNRRILNHEESAA